METKLKTSNKAALTDETNESVLSIINPVFREQHKHDPKMGAGACMISGCGCPQYLDNQGTCCNLNQAGGTCNHLPGDHR